MKKLIILFFLILLVVPVCIAKTLKIDFIKAVEKGNYNAVVSALKDGADPNMLTLNGEFTALILAIDNNDLKMAQILLDYGADPNLHSGNDMSPVMRVVIRNHPDDNEILRLLLEHGADFTSPSDFQYTVNPVSLALKLKNYNAFNMFNEYKHFGKCDIAFYKMQGQMIKNAEHWKAVETWKSCKMLPPNDSLIGLTFDEVIRQFGKPDTSTNVGKKSFEMTYVNLYSQYIDNPVRKVHWILRKESMQSEKRKLINRCKDDKTFYIDDDIVVDVRNSEQKSLNSIMFYSPKM